MSKLIDGSSFVVGFCGDPFWFNDEFGSPNSTKVPSLSWCFQHSVLASLPPVFLILFLPVTLMEIRASQNPGIKWSKLTSAKFVCFFFSFFKHFKFQLITLALIVIKVLLLIRSFWQGLINREKVPVVEYLYPVEHILALVSLSYMKYDCYNMYIDF